MYHVPCVCVCARKDGDGQTDDGSGEGDYKKECIYISIFAKKHFSFACFSCQRIVSFPYLVC